VIDGRTIADLEAAGFTHIKAVCASCGSIVQHPFRLLRTSNGVDDHTTIATVRRRYVCKGCGSRTASAFEPWRQG
jgi:DNA-directed RNA polymerase subunit RPC12/RpoP